MAALDSACEIGIDFILLVSLDEVSEESYIWYHDERYDKLLSKIAENHIKLNLQIWGST